MKTTLKSRNFWIMVLAWGGFWIVAPYPPRLLVFDVVNGLSIAACIGLIFIYYPSVAKRLKNWRWFMRNDLSGAHYFVAALCGMCIYVIMRHSYNQIWRIIVRPTDPYQNSLFVAWMVWFVTTIAYIFIIAVDLDEGHVPSRNWWWAGVVLAFGLSTAAIIAAIIEPDPPHWLVVLFNALVW